MREKTFGQPRRPRRAWSTLGALVLGALLVGGSHISTADSRAGGGTSEDLRSAAAFASIEDKEARAAALFTEAAKVLTHARCVNCHPAGDQPLQGEAAALHQPVVRRGADGFGAVGMRCGTCHQEANFDPGRVPGAPHWHLAPPEMAWEGLGVGEICEQLKDPARNGERSLADIVQHMREDPLVAWGWEPGADREPAPGDQETLSGLIAAWVEAGASCPQS